jgi:ribosomal protein S18 acetylase RimI-like enzyme
LAVKKKYQGQGFGTELVKFIEKYSKKKKFRKIFIYTGKPMKKTRKFYEKLNYEFVNEFEGYYGYQKGNTTAILYGKKL